MSAKLKVEDIKNELLGSIHKAMLYGDYEDFDKLTKLYSKKINAEINSYSGWKLLKFWDLYYVESLYNIERLIFKLNLEACKLEMNRKDN